MSGIKWFFSYKSLETDDDEVADLLEYNEKRANHYTAFCLRITACIAALMWMLNILGFFIVDKTMMNIVMPVGIVMLLLPSFLERSAKVKSNIMKYVIMGCFLAGVAMMSTVLTLQLILAWACPLILSCHYYSPRLTSFTLVGTLLLMLVSFYTGLLIGVWDGNVMRSSVALNSIPERLGHINAAIAAGDNIPLRAFNFYYLPRAVILFVTYLVCITLSKRTNSLLLRQYEATKEKERISAELNVATQIQTSMLPRIFPTFSDMTEFDIFATMNPAKEVGGDFYDFFMVDERNLVVVMADVSGKGVPAALFMVIGKTLIKDHTQNGGDLSEIFAKVNNLLCESNSEGLFITAFEGVLNLDSGEFTFVNAGHERPFICSSGNFEMRKINPGFVLAGMENIKYKTDRLFLKPGDMIFQYTDGVTEATDSAEELYGEERLARILQQNRDKSPEQLLYAVKEDIDSFVGDAPQFDDITMLALEYKGSGEHR